MPFTHQENVGVVGAYTTENLPMSIVSKISKGLTSVDSSYNIKPAIAKSWQVKNNGKTYIFTLNDNIYYSDGTKLTSYNIKYNFLDVTVETPNSNTIIFNLKNSYSPFLVTVSRPVFKNGFVGVGDYRVSSINLNGDFVDSISLVSRKGVSKEISYQFYPTEEALKTAFTLGNISKTDGVKDTKFLNKNIADFPKVKIEKKIDYSELVTVFYDTNDPNLSDKRLREALSYAVPDNFSYGQRNYGPFNPNSWVSVGGLTTYQQDYEHSKLLLTESQIATKGSTLFFEIKTLPQYVSLSKNLQSEWKKIGINTKIKVVESRPSTFQIFIGDFNLPKDPDEYTLWHSDQQNNITKYKNLRIDKLLEDGRQTTDLNTRRKIYQDLQKYLLDDPPATFLYFPYVYEITRI